MPHGAKQWREHGRLARKVVPRTSLGAWQPAESRRDPVDILAEQARTRVPGLIALRYRRMLRSPFAFYRGAAAVMAADLGARRNTGLRAQLAGDAHLANFGGYASPERDFVFDLNDFDETLPGPFEWDVMRLVASFEVAARDRGFADADRQALVHTVARSYREAMAAFAGMSRLEVWYARLDASDIAARWGAQAGSSTRKRFQALVAKAQTKTGTRALAKLTEREGDTLRIRSQPPVLVPIEQLMPQDDAHRLHAVIAGSFAAYRQTLQADRQHLFSGYEMIGMAHKVVGVGSVGTRCWVVLLEAEGDVEDPLVLQVKQAEASVLEPFAGASRLRSHGKRVVTGQRLMQASSDIFLGWTSAVGVDGVRREYYVRQLWDWKESADLTAMALPTYSIYAQICGWTLARAHARSGNRAAIAAYLGTSDIGDCGFAEFAQRYADQNAADHAALHAAADAGRIEVADSDPAEKPAKVQPRTPAAKPAKKQRPASQPAKKPAKRSS